MENVLNLVGWTIRNTQKTEQGYQFTAEVGLDEKTIRNVFHDYVDVLDATHFFQTPRWLGIDVSLLVRK